MASEGETSLLPLDDYEAIEQAVMETQRGRWFLAEYARRNRTADTGAIVETLERLERSIKREKAVPEIDRIRLDLADMAEAIARTKLEIAEMATDSDKGGRFEMASMELDAIVSQTEVATNTILLNAEKIQELAWTLREHGVDDALCDALDVCTTEIYTGCSFQDLTGQRTRKVVTVLRYLESRINTMIGIWSMGDLEESGLPTTVQNPAADPFDTRPDAHLLNGPALEGQGVNQAEIDDMMFDSIDDIQFDQIDRGDDAEVVEIEPAAGPTEAHDAADAEVEAASDIAAEADVFAPAGVAMASSEAEGEAGVETTATELEADVAPEPAEAEHAADVSFTGDLLADDLDMVDAGDFADRLPADPLQAAADVFAPAPAAPQAAAAPVAGPVTTTVAQRVGNTVMSLEVDLAADTAIEIAPALAVVPTNDPIANMSVARKLTTFG